jgi:hypothetical protein
MIFSQFCVLGSFVGNKLIINLCIYFCIYSVLLLCVSFYANTTFFQLYSKISSQLSRCQLLCSFCSRIHWWLKFFCGSIWPLLYRGTFFLYINCREILLWKDVNFVKYFVYIYWHIHIGLSFVLLMGYIKLFICMLNPSCIPGTNFSWSLSITLLIWLSWILRITFGFLRQGLNSAGWLLTCDPLLPSPKC